MSNHILVVDDEQEMRNLLKFCLKTYDFKIDEAANGEEAFDKMMDHSYDLIILDIMMPEKDGFELLKSMQNEIENQVPVILLSALGDTERVVEGLRLGADDYIVKPFEPKELAARVESVLRRFKKIKLNTYTVEGLLFQPDSFHVSYQNRTIPLTKKEFQIFYRLASHRGRVYSREMLLELEWGIDYEGDNRTVDTHVKNIREKLNEQGYHKTILETVWGVGYKIPEANE
ncbi:response regulator transcription factor [Evansella halocellulosilytica]|uniref:response regulator transcription factor n=1 Tax=Evansella halocellulosilytica TaxID=2011013 RepID=UPI000BB70C64|nr:response regulator transcription factor [Evansella halocellulosilytica]